jgi:hypothetical protein
MSEKELSNGVDSTESIEYSSWSIGANMPPVRVDAAGRISAGSDPFPVGGPGVSDAARLVSYDSTGQATSRLDGLAKSGDGPRGLPSDSVLTPATNSGGSSVALGTSGNGNDPIWISGPDTGGNVQIGMPVDGSFNRPAYREAPSDALALNVVDSTESTEYSSMPIGPDKLPVWVDAAGRNSTHLKPLPVGGPEVLDAASFLSYDSTAQAMIRPDLLGTSGDGKRELPSDSALTSTTDSQGSSVALGTSGNSNGPIWLNGPDTGGNVQIGMPVDGSFNRPAYREAPSDALSLSGNVEPAFTAIGSNGRLMHGVHFHQHDHHHRVKPSAGAPSIAGISDVSQSTGHHSHNTSVVKNSVPTMIGFGLAGDVIFVFDGRSQIGSTTVHADGTWVFTTPALLNGQHDFSVGAINPASGAMLTSNHLAVQVFVQAHPGPTAIATITSALDEFIDPAGNHHDNVIQNGDKTFDTSPKLLGTLDIALHAGETLVMYRDGVKLGLADVSGLGWSFQDTGVTAGEHIYTARVESATGVQGAESANFGIVEAVPESLDRFPMLLTDNFLIFDTRGISRMTSDGKSISFDLLEGVKSLEAHGMTVSYTEKDGFISIGVDWMSYLKAHPDSYAAFDFVAHRHIDNDKGGLDLYDRVGTPLFTPFANMLDTWIRMPAQEHSRLQPATPPAATFITGIYDVYTDESGNPMLSLIPNGSSTASSTHKIVLTFSEPLQQGWLPDWWEIYRDGVRLLPNQDLLEFKYDQATNTGWAIETNVPPGPHVYTARVPRTYGEQGPWSESYSILELAPAPTAVATITSALDEFIDPAGIHHDSVIQNGDKTADTSPQLHGTLSATLHDGEILAIYRDGQKIGTASVTGLGWSYQDEGLTTGQHVYTASVIAASGEQGVHSEDFVITETAGTPSGSFQFLATEDFLIFDTRFVPRAMSDGKAISVDLLEGVRILEKAGMTVKSYTDNDGVISIEVDWIAYVKAHPDAYFDLIMHRHIDNDQGGLNYYNLIAVPDFGILLNLLGSWRPAFFVQDAGGQSPTPAAEATISGIFDSYVDAEGHVQLSLVPAGGASGEASHRIEGTLSEPMSKWSDSLVIYRDGEKLTGDNHSFDPLSNHSNTTWWIIDNDVPPGPHVYTARVEREFEAQGRWSPSYPIQELTHEPTQDSLTARMLMNDNLLVVETGILNHTNADGSVASTQLKAELTLAGSTIAVFEAGVDEAGTAAFKADWARMIAANPNATLTITAHDNVSQSDQIVDKHIIGTLAGQIGHWVTTTPDGESAAFFNAADRSIHIHGNADINTITVADDHQLIDLTSLTGKTIGSTIMGIERIDLGGQHNTLKIAMIDVLNLGETDLFRADGKQQFMVNGKAAVTVELSNTRVAGIADGDWERQGNATIGGVVYDVYEHSTAHVELMLQQGVQLSMH